MTKTTNTETSPALSDWYENQNVEKVTPASEFYKAHLSVGAIQASLDKAMTAAGAEGILTVVSHEDRSDSFADLDGVKVEASSALLLARAVMWLSKSLAPKVARYRTLSGNQAAIYQACPTSGVVLFRRWSLGD